MRYADILASRPVRGGLVAGVVVAGIYSLLASNNTPTPQSWFTGLAHETVWGSWPVTITSATPPQTVCESNTPPRVDPPTFWAAQPTAATNISDLVGTTLWSSTDTCPRAMQFSSRSIMIADLSTFYAKFPAGTQGIGNRISKATLDFTVASTLPTTNPAGFPCSTYIGGVGKIFILEPNPVITQGANQVAVDTTIHAGLVLATSAGQATGPDTIAAFPAVGDLAGDLTLIGAAGSYSNGAVVVVDTGPNLHDVKVDVMKWVRGATNLSMPTIGFTVASINETTINPASPVQFACQVFVEPTSLTVQFN
jgi:hypothetical protein